MHALTEKYRHYWQQIGLSEAEIERRRLPLFAEAMELKTAERSPDGREFLLTPAAAAAWKRMKAAASADGAEIHIVSAYRSVERQVQLIAAKLAGKQTLDAVLRILAPPGCSEHHTGRAIDVATGTVRPLDAEFDTTHAFEWLVKHAANFGFTLSFPENNPFGYVYEPWHWCYGESGFGKAGS
ncbi:D-alanyl-D-alanine carboxypeptidase family protein [Methylomonas sp. HYX-M1]|uniref:M15 family metallopeptidase n=1 Tax=Methylomonas sp. HYX-M1 TaxID=3139307 RepID=UPI00345BD926